MKNPTEELRLIYITAQNMDEAKRVGEALVADRLVACVNLIPGMESIYHWEGKVCRSSEVVLIAKTQEAFVSSVIDRVKQIHSYKVPCVVALPILAGNPDYLNWIIAETKKAPV